MQKLSLFFTAVVSHLCLFAEYQEWSEFSAILKPSVIPGGGVGVFATHDIKAGTALFVDSVWRIAHTYDLPPEFEPYVVYLTDDFCFGPERFDQMGVSYYINHSLNPNIEYTSDEERIAIRDIKAGEEFTENYCQLYELYGGVLEINADNFLLNELKNNK